MQDGASSTYGSDAIAGAVNLILHNDVDGTRFDVLYGNTTDKDAAVKQFSFLHGFTADKTHITVAGSHYHRNALARIDRELSRTGDFTDRGATVNYNASIPSTGDYFYTPGGGGFVAVSGPDTNLNSVTTDIPEQQILSAFAAFEHEITEQVTVYSDFLFSNNRTDSKFFGPFFTAPFDAPASIVTAANNSPFNPLGPTDSITGITYNLQDALGGFQQEWESEGFRMVGGVKGYFNAFDWDFGALHTETDIVGNFSNAAIDADAFVAAIDAGFINPIQNDPSNFALLKSMEVPLVNTYKEEMSLADFKIHGELLELPAGPVQFAAGAEFRHESIEFVDDPIHATTTVVGWFDLSNFSGERDCKSIYVETIAPLVADTSDAIPGIEVLELNFGGRFEDFSDEGIDPSATSDQTVNNKYDSFDYKVAFRYKPIEQILFRTSYSTAFRAPTLAESYSKYDALNRIQLTDPLGDTPAGTRVATLFRGNAELEPETAQIISFGTTLTPFSGLTVKVDYYDIQREDAIVNGAQFIVDQAAADPAGPYADLVTRSGTNALQFVNSVYFNAAEMITRGIDYRVNYNHSFGTNNTLDLTLGANQFLTYKIKASPNSGYQSFKGKTVDSARNDISPGSIPTWKGFFSTRWFIDNATLGGTVNYIGSYKDDGNFTSSPVETDVASYTTLDLLFSYDMPTSVTALLQSSTITVGVNNVFDRPPPFSAGSLAGPPLGGYDQSLYSQRNRYWYFALAKEF